MKNEKAEVESDGKIAVADPEMAKKLATAKSERAGDETDGKLVVADSAWAKMLENANIEKAAEETTEDAGPEKDSLRQLQACSVHFELLSISASAARPVTRVV